MIISGHHERMSGRKGLTSRKQRTESRESRKQEPESREQEAGAMTPSVPLLLCVLLKDSNWAKWKQGVSSQEQKKGTGKEREGHEVQILLTWSSQSSLTRLTESRVLFSSVSGQG